MQLADHRSKVWTTALAHGNRQRRVAYSLPLVYAQAERASEYACGGNQST